MLEGEAMYREHIMDHYSNPRNKGKLENPTFVHTDANPLCGDAVSLTVNIEERKVKEIKFDGVGCAISMAAASILTEVVQEKSIDEVLVMTREDMIEQLGAVVTPARIKCAMLALSTLKEGLKKYNQ